MIDITITINAIVMYHEVFSPEEFNSDEREDCSIALEHEEK